MKLNKFFQKKEQHTVLTRSLEKLESDFNRTLNPFIIGNLQYLAPVVIEEANYSILPIRLTIHSSFENFFAFLNYIENSGTLSEKTRLLDISSITINFVSSQGAPENLSGRDEINFNVSMSAAFRSTETDK